MPRKEILDIEITGQSEVEESASGRLNILSWLCHHASQIAKGSVALMGLAVLGGVGYLARGALFSGRKPSDSSDVTPKPKTGTADAQGLVVKGSDHAPAKYEAKQSFGFDGEAATDLEDRADIAIADGKIEFGDVAAAATPQALFAKGIVAEIRAENTEKIDEIVTPGAMGTFFSRKLLSSNDAPIVVEPIQDQIVNVGEIFSLVLDPTQIFSDADGDEIAITSVTLSDGSPLPAWLQLESLLTSAVLKGVYDTPGNPEGVAINGSYAYVADRNSGLQIIDISNPASPVLKGGCDTAGEAMAVVISGNYAYVADRYSGLQIIDVNDPASPVLKKTYATPGYACSVIIRDNYAYMAALSSGLQILDITDPINPVFKGAYNTPGNAEGVAVSGNYAYVADWTAGLQIIDISNPASPVLKGTYDTPGYARGVIIRDNYAYVADYTSGLRIIDISNPVSPILKGSCNTPGPYGAVGVAISDNYAYVADGYSGLQIIDISDPTNPVLKGTYNTSGNAWGVAISGNYAYVADWDSGLQIIEVNLAKKKNLTGTPTGSNSGVLSIKVTADDGNGGTVSDVFDLTVEPSLIVTHGNQTATYIEDTTFDFENIVIETLNTTVDVTLIMSDMNAGALTTGISGNVTSTFASGVWQVSGNVTAINQLLAGLQFIPTPNSHGNFAISVQVDDHINQVYSDTISMAGIAVNDPPVLTTNQLIINGGQTLILSTGNFNVTDPDTAATNLTFTVSDIQHGRFERVSAAGAAITTFTLQDIQTSQIQFVHDGSAIAPSYNVIVSDGIATTVIASGNISFSFVSQAGSEFQINTYVGYQTEPSIAALIDGKFVVTWMSVDQDGSTYGIYGQLYNSNGTKYGTEFQINTYTTDWQAYSSVAALIDGRFVVTWESLYQDGGGWGVYGQLYNSDGTKFGAEFQVNTYTAGSQYVPSVTGLSDGKFVVMWTSEGQDGSGAGIYGQLYNSDGTKFSTEFQVNTYTAGSQYVPSVTGLSDGKFVVTWISYGQDGDVCGVYGQLYNGDGTKFSTEFRINTYTTSYQSSPSVAGLSDGKFVVTWMSSGQDGSGYGIFGQSYNNDGTKLGVEFQVNIYTASDQFGPSVASLTDGKFVVTWTSDGQDGSSYGIYGQLYNSDGAKFGVEFQVNTYTASMQQRPSVIGLTDGKFVITWGSYGQDGSGSGVYGQIFSYPTSLTLTANRLSVIEGQPLILDLGNFNAFSPGVAASNLTFSISGLQHGQFERISASGVAITTFTLQNIQNSQIRFVHDGGEIAPSYFVAVSDNASTTDPIAASISFTHVNDAPVITISPEPISYIENNAAVIIAPTLNITDTDSANLASAVVKITAGFFTGEDLLSFVPRSGITGSYDFQTGILTFNGTASIAAYQTVLRSIAYRDSSQNPSTTNRMVTFQVTDDGGTISEAVTKIVQVISVNDAPIVNVALQTQASCCAIGVGQAYIFTFAANTFTDIDGDTLTYNATQVDDSALPSWLTFTPLTRTFSGTPLSSSDIGNLNLKVKATDPNGASVSDTFTLNIAKTLSATNTAAPIAYIEDTEYNLADIVITTPSAVVTVQLTLSNPAAGNLTVGTSNAVTSTYNQITGVWEASGNKADVNALLASLKYQPAANYNGAFSIAVSITDGYGQSLSSTINAIGTAVNDAPLLTVNRLTIIEGQALILTTAQLNASDVDNLPSELTFTVSNIKHGRFVRISAPQPPITAFTLQEVLDRRIKFVHDGSKKAPSYDVSVSDGVTSTVAAAATIRFTNADDKQEEDDPTAAAAGAAAGGAAAGIGLGAVGFWQFKRRKKMGKVQKLTDVEGGHGKSETTTELHSGNAERSVSPSWAEAHPHLDEQPVRGGQVLPAELTAPAVNGIVNPAAKALPDFGVAPELETAMPGAATCEHLRPNGVGVSEQVPPAMQFASTA